MDELIIKHLIASSTAAVVAELATLPIYTAKTNFQNSKQTSIVKTAFQMFKNGGVRCFYASCAPSVSVQIVSTSLKFTIYKHLECVIDSKVARGAICGSVVSVVTHPLDVLKINQQMGDKAFPDSKRLLYRGFSKSLAKSTVGCSTFFPIFETLKERYGCSSHIAGLGSAFISTTILQPFDYMKTRHIYGLSFYNGINPFNYFKGLSLNLMRVVPHFTIMMTTMDLMIKNL